MGDVPSCKQQPTAPFTAVGCDFMGPYTVKGMCLGRRQFKFWVAVYTCFYSHASVLLPTPGYDTATFLTSHTTFYYTYGSPELVVVDHGRNLVAAAERPDWRAVARASGCNTDWRITPKGCPWRAGQVERVVGMAKKMLHNLLAGQTFSGDFHKFSSLCARIGFLLNSQPVATQLQRETDFYLITPNDIILGRAARPRGQVSTHEELEEAGVSLASLSHMEKVARSWHASFVMQVWPLLVPHNKWLRKQPNLEVRDIGHKGFPVITTLA